MRVALALLFALAPAPLAAQAAPSCIVQRVVDGDTLTCEGGERVRLLLVNTPEMGQEPYGPIARAVVEALSPPGTRLEIRLDVEERDRYGRLLAYVYLPDGRMLNRVLARRGFAQTMVIPPNVRHVETIRAAVDSARREEAGFWGPGILGSEESSAERRPAEVTGPRAREDCHPSYPDVCIPPSPPDLDCRDIPHRRFRVVGSDPHRFDGDGDGVGCEGRAAG